MWTENCQMFKLDLETAEAAEIKLPTSSGYQRSKRVPENHLLLLYLLHQNLWLCASQQTVEHSSRDRNTRPPYLSPEKYVCRSWSNRHETTDWFQIGKGVSQSCILSSFLFNLYAEYIMQNAGLDEAPAGIKIARGEISITSDMQMTQPWWPKAKKNWRPSWWKWKRRVKKLA